MSVIQDVVKRSAKAEVKEEGNAKRAKRHAGDEGDF